MISFINNCVKVCRSPDDFSLLGTSMDDAIGEAYDKVYTRTLFPESQSKILLRNNHFLQTNIINNKI